MQVASCRSSLVVVPWGTAGARAREVGDGAVSFTPAFPPPGGRAVVDTVGAGDTFNAAVIAALLRGLSVGAAIEFGARIAGAKVGVHGYDVLPFVPDALAATGATTA